MCYQEYHVYQGKSNDILNFYLLRKDFEVIGENTIIRYQSEFAKGNNKSSVDFGSYYPSKQKNVYEIKYKFPIENEWVNMLGNRCNINSNFSLADDTVKWSVSTNKKIFSSEYKALQGLNWSQCVYIETNKTNLITTIRDTSNLFYEDYECNGQASL
jgi:hypothetical protein